MCLSLSFMFVNDTPERHRGAGYPPIFALPELQETRKRAAGCLLAKGRLFRGMFGRALQGGLVNKSFRKIHSTMKAGLCRLRLQLR